MSRVLVGFVGEVVVDDNAVDWAKSWPDTEAHVALRTLVEAELREHEVRVVEVRWWDTELKP